MPYSMPLWTILTKCPAPWPPQCRSRPARAPASRASARMTLERRPRRRPPSGSSRPRAPDAAAGARVEVVDAVRLRAARRGAMSSWKLELPPSMSMSPGASSGAARRSRPASASPSGSMSQIARGAGSAATTSASVAPGSAPCAKPPPPSRTCDSTPPRGGRRAAGAAPCWRPCGRGRPSRCPCPSSPSVPREDSCSSAGALLPRARAASAAGAR